MVELGQAVFLVALASFPSVIWFYYFRRQMIKRQIALASWLEDHLKPRDKLYMYLGYLVGFRARYLLGDPRVSEIHVTYTTPPYHVFFYLPVIIAFGKKEKLDILVKPRSGVPMRGEAHIVDWSVRSVRLAAQADLVGDYKTGTLEASGRRYTVYYRGAEEALEKARRILLALTSRGARVFRVSYDSSRRAILVSLEPTGVDHVEAALRLARAALR